LEDVPDVYSDQVQITSNIFGMAFTFGVRAIDVARLIELREDNGDTNPTLETFEANAVVRMSHNHAKLMVMIARNLLKEYEKRSGEIYLPPELYELSKLNPEDW